ncbi:uncharacterized protein LOC127001154 isoform X3 [Eriocheir sinensis]|uniref:uncharacterized protein LOC127001154 isoform X3 n=1 Tax=Eriocheir sinensis TaxID=95602 RepID=UPI0021C5C85E|nr:uncharacterized protein LOC127001154 isoform X3 [Eriocheir sinensis]
MAVCPALALYTWYHQHKKKDLGVGQKDWLQFLQEQANQNDQKEYNAKSSIKTKICKGTAKDECVLQKLQVEKDSQGDLGDCEQKKHLQDEGNSVESVIPHHSVKVQSRRQTDEQDEVWDQSSSHSQEMTRAQLPLGEAPTTPLSALLNTSLSSPTLLLPLDNNTSLEETALYSPTLPLCDETFSPAKRGESPRDTIMESLAGNLDGSEVSWSSALATPTSNSLGQVLDGTSPSTLERQTLHPRQGLRENVLARSLFSPQASGAAGSSSSGELSPGLGIIRCFSPVPRFSCRPVCSVQARRPSCGEDANPGWLEAGTQGFRVNFSIEENVALKRNVEVTLKDNLEMKTVTESGAHSPDRQVNICAGVRPDQTSTPAQPRPVRARHLILAAQSPESPGFVEPIPHARGIKKNERVQETDPLPDTKEMDKLNEKVIYSDGLANDTSDVDEYSYGSAEDPFDIICSPVSKVKKKRKKKISNSKLTSGKSNQKLEKNIDDNSLVDEGNEKTKQKAIPGGTLSSHSGMVSGASSNKNLHQDTGKGTEYNKYKRESSCKAKNNIAEDINCKSEYCSKEHPPETTDCEAVKGLTSKPNTNLTSSPSGKHVAALVAKTETGNLLENTNKDKEDHVMITRDSRKDIFSAQISEQQKRKSTDTLSLYKNKRISRRFVYPVDLSKPHVELNVSHTKTGRKGKGGSKPASPGRKGATCSSPTNRSDETRQNEASVPLGPETSCGTPANRCGDEKGTETAEPGSKRVMCSSPNTPFKPKEQLDVIAHKQKKFLPLASLGQIDTSEASLRSSVEPLGAVEYGHEETYLGSEQAPITKKGNEGSDHALQVVPVAPNAKGSIMEVTGKISASGSTLTENMDDKYNCTSKNTEISFMASSSDLANVAHSLVIKNQEAECNTDLLQPHVPQIGAVGNPATQGPEGEGEEEVSGAPNNQVISDTFSDIDFSDSDFDISIPVREEGVGGDHENIKAKEGSNQSLDAAPKEKVSGDLFSECHSDKSSGFKGFITGSGKQVKISEKALLEARKFLEEELNEDGSLSPHQVPPGEKGEARHLSGMHKTSNSNQCSASKTGSLSLASDLSAASSAGVVAEVFVTPHIGNKLNVLEVANSQVIKVTNIKHPQTKDTAFTDVCESSRRHTVDGSVTQSVCSKLKSTSDDTASEAEREGKETIEAVKLHCAESTMFSEEVKPPEDTQTISKSAQSKANTFHGFCTAAGSKVTISKEAAWRAQLLWEEVDANMELSLNKEANMQCEHNVLGNEQSGRLKNSATPTELRKGDRLDGSERSELSETNNKTNGALNMEVGFHTARGKKISVDQTSITQAQSLWAEAASCEATIPGTEGAPTHLSTASDGKHFVPVNEGFSTAKGNKIAVKESSITQAYSLWKEAISCEVASPGHEGPKKKPRIPSKPEHYGKVLCKRVTSKSDGQSLEGMKSATISNSVQTSPKDRNSLSEKASDKKVPELQGRGNFSNTFTESSERCIEDSRRVFSRPAGMPMAAGIGSSIASDVNIRSENFAIKARRLFEDDKPLQSGSGCQSPTLVTQNRNNCKSYKKNYTHNEKGDTVEGSLMKVSENVESGPKTSGQSLQINPLNSVIKQDSACHLSNPENNSTLDRPLGKEGVKADVNQSIELNAHLNTIEGKLLEGVSQKMKVGHPAKSCNSYESMHKGNDFQKAETEFCGFLTGNKKQIKVTSESLQVAKQLLQECASNEGTPEKAAKPSYEMEKSYSSTDDKQVTTVESFMAVTDHNGGTVSESHDAVHGSPILGSQKRSKGKNVKRRSYVTACQELQDDLVNSHEILDISDITEAFLKDQLLDPEEVAKGSINQRKRSRGRGQDEEVSLSKKTRRNVIISQHEACDEAETSRNLAQKQQEKLVQSKERQAIQPIPGFLYKLRKERKEERIKLQSLGSLKTNRKSRPEALGVAFSSAAQYRFEVPDSRCGTVDCGDGCVVVPGTDGCAGVEEVELGFLVMPGVHPGLLPPSWVPNHYHLIVWQLASMERRLPDCGQALTLKNVVARLKYRYDREIDRAERSILRKVTEQDDVPQKTMVLCVTKVKMDFEVERKEAVKSCTADTSLHPLLELTDGWYRIGAVVDKAMVQLIGEEKVKVGTKLVLHGAELVGATSPCHPLQATSTLCLHLHTNMTRRARWWARLGLLPQRGPIPSLIENTFCNGGLVGKVNVMVARLYTLYYEPSQGLYMSEKAALKRLQETEKERERTIEQITAEVEKELYQQEKEETTKRDWRTMNPEEIRGLTQGQDISRLLNETADPSSLEGLLTLHQLQLARTWREQHAEGARRRLHQEVTRRLAETEKPLEIVPLMKVRIIDGKRDGALVTVWRPSLEFREMLAEESYFIIHYLMAVGFRWGSRQFKSTRQTKWERSMRGPLLWRSEYARSVTPLCLTNLGELRPLWQEVDVTGVVLRVGKPNTKFQAVHLVDHHLNILAVHFWGGLKSCGYADTVVEGALVCLMNCSWRGHKGSSIGCIHFTEFSIATCSFQISSC